MTSSLTDKRQTSPALWNPYLAGVLLGLVLLATFAITGRGLGATAAFSALSTTVIGAFWPEHAASNLVHQRYWNDGAPWMNWTLWLLIGAALGAWLASGGRTHFAWRVDRGPQVSDRTRLLLAFFGGVVAAFGARLAKGCTSGQALTGGSMLNAGSLVFMGAVFASAYALAWFVRKEWL